jgi:hypothetical protein
MGGSSAFDPAGRNAQYPIVECLNSVRALGANEKAYIAGRAALDLGLPLATGGPSCFAEHE